MLGFRPLGTGPLLSGAVSAPPPASAVTSIYYARMNDEMSVILRQSTAGQDVIIGSFIDDTDFKTPETGLTIANTDIKLMKDGAASVNKNSGGATHRINGDYSITLDATDTNTVGELRVSVDVAGALPVWKTFQVIEEATYDLKYSSGATGDVTVDTNNDKADYNIASIDANAINAASIAASALDGKGDWNIGKTGYSLTQNFPTNFENMVITAGGATDALVQGYLNTLLTEATAGRIAGNFDTFFENADAATTKTVDDVGGSLTQQNVRDATKLSPTAGAPSSGSVDEHLDDILQDTGTDIPNQISNQNDISAAQVNAEVLDVMTVDTFAEVSTPAATASLKDMIHYVFSSVRNKITQTSTTKQIRNDSDTGNLGTSTVSDDGTTFTKGEDS